MEHDAAESHARRRRREVAPVTRDYGDLSDEMILWPFVTLTTRPGVVTAVAAIDRRGHRVSRHGDATASSDDAPADAGFVLGGSYVFGVGAGDDSGTLPSMLWRQTGKPYVNLGIRQANSTQELVTALPFAERATTFLVCSGLNNFSLGLADPLDPLFGPSYMDRVLRRLRRVSVEELFVLMKTVDGAGRLAAVSDADLRRELARRMRARFPGRRRSDAPPAAKGARTSKKVDPDPEAVVDRAARLQLRDLRALRRLVPDEAEVFFALQPVAPQTGKELSDEERTLFDALDVMQAKTRRWGVLSRLFESHWPAYAARLEQGCSQLGVPFADLSRADYTGWCFIDRIHMTDRGYELSAAFLQEAMAGVAR